MIWALVRFAGAFATAALVHFAATAVWTGFPAVCDLFLLVAVLVGRRGQPVPAMFAGLAAGLVTDAFSGSLYGLHGFADTIVGFGTARAARQLVVQRRSSLALVFAAAAAAQQLVLSILLLVFGSLGELPRPAEMAAKVATTAVLGMAWNASADTVVNRVRLWRRERSRRLGIGR